jgi:hypothetical protein
VYEEKRKGKGIENEYSAYCLVTPQLMVVRVAEAGTPLESGGGERLRMLSEGWIGTE